MFMIGFWFLLGIVGLGLCVGGVVITTMYEPTIGFMATIFGGLLLLFPIMQTAGIVKRFKLAPFFMTLKDEEEITLFVNDRSQIHPFVVNTKHEGILQQKMIGLIDDKGSPLTWGDVPCSISKQRLGVSLDINYAQYTANLDKDRGLNSYEEAIEEYLGPMKYAEFFHKYRKNPKPDILEITSELKYLIHNNEPNNPLVETIAGETIDFKSFCNYLLYAYHPRSSQNAMDAEKIIAKKEAMAYKETDKVGSIGKLIFVIVIAIVIFLVVWSALGGVF